jgi:hypothetical protein
VTVYERRFTRANLLKAERGRKALGLALARPAFAGIEGSSTTLNWLTWSDHYANDQLAPSRAQPQSRAADALQRQLRRIPEDQADRQPVRHRLG